MAIRDQWIEPGMLRSCCDSASELGKALAENTTLKIRFETLQKERDELKKLANELLTIAYDVTYSFPVTAREIDLVKKFHMTYHGKEEE